MGTNYIVIQDWMISKLDLKGNDLIVYALIYGFSQDGKSEFKGSIRYIQKWSGVSIGAVHNILKRLEQRKLIEKVETENHNEWNYYKTKGVQNVNTRCSENERGCSENEHKCSENEHINNTNNNTNKDYIYIEGRKVFDFINWFKNNWSIWLNNQMIEKVDSKLQDFFEENVESDFKDRNHVKNSFKIFLNRNNQKEKISGKKEKGKDFRNAVDELLKQQNNEK